MLCCRCSRHNAFCRGGAVKVVDNQAFIEFFGIKSFPKESCNRLIINNIACTGTALRKCVSIYKGGSFSYSADFEYLHGIIYE